MEFITTTKIKNIICSINNVLLLFFYKDPEALAQLMKNMPLTNDGKFLLLEAETGDTTNGAEEDLESEA